MIYADHAATSPILPCAQKAMMECMKYGANPSSQHAMGVWAKEKLEEAREKVANCINASPEEIIFTSGATESNNLAAHAAKKFWIDKVYVSSYEHKSMEKAARILSFENKLPFNQLSWREINKPYLLNKNMQNSFVSINMVDSITGLISDVQGFSHYFFDTEESIIHTDATQAIGHMKIDVHKLNIDMMTFSSHKIGGPLGVGVLYVRKGVDIEPLIYGGNQENGLRSGTENVPAIVGFAAAMQERCNNIDKNRKKIKRLHSIFTNSLKEAKPVVQNDYITKRHATPHIIPVFVPNIENDALVSILSDKYGICISAGSACDNNNKNKKHNYPLITEFYFRPEYITDIPNIRNIVRVSFSPENKPEEVRQIAKAINEITDSF